MAELTTTSHAILGLLARRDCTTYELAQQMQRKLHFVWPRAERKLYEEPRRLVEAGFATSEKDMIGRRARTIYSITPEGRAELKRWLKDEPIDPPSFEFDGMVRVLFTDQADAATLRSALHRIAEQAVSERARFELAAEAAARKNGTTHPGDGPEQRSLDRLQHRFMLEHFERIRDWALWALAEVERWPVKEPNSAGADGAVSGGATPNGFNAGVAVQMLPDTSIEVVSIDE